MIVKLLTEHHLEILSLKGGCRGSSKSILVKMLNCWKSHAVARECIYHFHMGWSYQHNIYIVPVIPSVAVLNDCVFSLAELKAKGELLLSVFIRHVLSVVHKLFL